MASMYLDWRGHHRLPSLNGITSTPLLAADGSIRSVVGYDLASGFWLENVPDVGRSIPETPTRADAESALLTLRKAFRSFCFADATTIEATTVGGPQGISFVDARVNPGVDESAALAWLLTAVCRASLRFAPGALCIAAETSGSGSGKGLLIRCICAIAHGRQPSAVTAGEKVEEMEKRLSAKLIESAPAILLDNVNGKTLKSDMLASALTESPAEIRVLGKTKMARLNASAFIAVTGNGLQVSEDLARRFIASVLDAGIEDPEARPFDGNILAEMSERRAELLAAALTIWRWGRQNELKRGAPLGGFEQWALWVRDPLVALGCKDPVLRVAEAKANDPRRQRTAEIFEAWWRYRGPRPTTISDLTEPVLALVDPNHRGRQYVARVVASLVGTRLAGFVLTRDEMVGKWTPSTYTLQITETPARGPAEGVQSAGVEPMTPMTPMAYATPDVSDARSSKDDSPKVLKIKTHRGHRGHGLRPNEINGLEAKNRAYASPMTPMPPLENGQDAADCVGEGGFSDDDLPF